MKVYFTEEKLITSHIVLLGKISEKYVKTFEGLLFTNIITDNQPNIDVVKQLIDAINPFVLTKRTVIVLNLLVDPFFEELCLLIKERFKMSAFKKRIIKKYIFGYLSDPMRKLVYSDPHVLGHEIYNSKKMYEMSKIIKEMM